MLTVLAVILLSVGAGAIVRSLSPDRRSSDTMIAGAVLVAAGAGLLFA